MKKKLEEIKDSLANLEHVAATEGIFYGDALRWIVRDLIALVETLQEFYESKGGERNDKM